MAVCRYIAYSSRLLAGLIVSNSWQLIEEKTVLLIFFVPAIGLLSLQAGF